MNITSDQIRQDASVAGPIIDQAATIGATVAPEYAAFIILGAAVAKGAPNLLADAIDLANKKEPTPEDNAAFQAKVTALRNPETL